MQYDEATHTLILGERKGSFNQMLLKRTFEIVWIDADHPVGLSLTARPHEVVAYEGKSVTVKMK
jgi:alpha-D-xyloside xylohydrolase